MTSADSMAERRDTNSRYRFTFVSLEYRAEVAGFSRGIYHQLSREDVRIEFA